MHRLMVVVACVAASVAAVPILAQTQMTVGIQDVLNSPEKFVNTRLQLVGEIRNPQQVGEVGRGTYQLSGPKGETITVQTKDLPGAEEMSGQYIVTGSVDVDPMTSMAIIWEGTRQSLAAATAAATAPPPPKKTDVWNYVLIGGGIVLVILIVALVAVLTAKPKAAPVAVQSGATVAAPPVPSAPAAAAPTQAYAPPGAPATQEFLGITLAITEGPDSGKSFAIAKSSTTIGRNAGQDVQLSDATVSREHARLLAQAGGLQIVNQSTRGTYVNDQEVDTKSLSDGDKIRMGSTVISVKMAVRAEAAAPVATQEYRPGGSAQGGATQEFLGGQLEVETGPHTGQVFVITRRAATVGRAPGQDVELSRDDTVSREHAQIRYQDGRFTLVAQPDKKVLVNGQEVVTVDLNDGDEVQLGGTKLRFRRL